MFYDRQIDPIKGRLVHADLKRLVFGQKIEVTVPIHLIGDPFGVREEDGVLEQVCARSTSKSAQGIFLNRLTWTSRT